MTPIDRVESVQKNLSSFCTYAVGTARKNLVDQTQCKIKDV